MPVTEAESSGNPERTYQLLIEVTVPLCLTIGRLGTFTFPAGHYVYTGSAVRHIEARIRRHQSQLKKKHWHIDYLLAAPGVILRQVLRHTVPECELNQQVAGAILVPGFGASDCRAGCLSHLKYLAGAVAIPN